MHQCEKTNGVTAFWTTSSTIKSLKITRSIYLRINVLLKQSKCPFLPPASEGWGKVLFSVCLSVNTSMGGGGAEVPQPGLDDGRGVPPGQVWMVGGDPSQVWMVGGTPGTPTMTGWSTPPTMTGWGTPPP